ncbi:MAG: methyltransferase domain-containing protein [Pseudomonadota bacterium]
MGQAARTRTASRGRPVRRGAWRTPLLGPAAFALWRIDAARKVTWIEPHLPPSARLLEIGSGPGSVLAALRARGRVVTAVDVADGAYTERLRATLYDGTTLPFAADAFDAALLLTTLHHTHDPLGVLREAARVAPRVLVVEDVYRSAFQRRLTKIADAVTNLEFRGHPHNNKDDAGWRAAFNDLGLVVRHADEKPYVGAFLQALYVLERAP